MTLNQLTLEWNGTRLCRMVGVALSHVILQVGVALSHVMLQVGVALNHVMQVGMALDHVMQVGMALCRKGCHVIDHQCQS